MVSSLLSSFEKSFLSELDDIYKWMYDLNRFFRSTVEGHIEDLHFSYPKMNIRKKKLENGQIKYCLEFLTPQFSKDDLKVKIADDNTLIVEGERKIKDTDEGKDEIIEFSTKTKFKRKVIIPNIQKDSVKVKLENGILRIELLSGKRERIEEIEIEG